MIYAIISNVIIILISILIIRGIRKHQIKVSTEDLLKDFDVIDFLTMSIQNVKINNSLHPLVVLVYTHFIKSPEDFKEVHCKIEIPNLSIKLWAANDVYDRDFRELPDDTLKKYNMTLKELNDSLSLADKTILDTIVKRVKVNNSEFIERIFI